MRLPADLLSRSAEEASRLVALLLLDETGAAAGRLGEPGDSEALHDFRVGLRRLRSSLRAYDSQLEGSVSKKTRRRLRKFTSETNVERDREVQLAWLREQTARLVAEETPGLAWMIGRLEGRAGEKPEIIHEVVRKFGKTATKLRPQLRTFRAEVRAGGEQKPPSFGRVTGELLRNEAAKLRENIAGVAGPLDADPAHRARITAKRMRYLLEPLAQRAPGVRTAVKSLKGLQDLLGELHDMQVISRDLGSALAGVSRLPNNDPPTEPGLSVLRRLAEEQGERCYAEFERSWRSERGSAFFRRIEGLSGFLVDELNRVRPEPPAPASTPEVDELDRQHQLAEGNPAAG